jgi:hypothetical protein
MHDLEETRAQLDQLRASLDATSARLAARKDDPAAALVCDELARMRAELTICRPLAKIIQRARFRLGGSTDTTTDCDEASLRENAEAALALLRETEAQIRAALEATQ